MRSEVVTVCDRLLARIAVNQVLSIWSWQFGAASYDQQMIAQLTIQTPSGPQQVRLEFAHVGEMRK